MTKQNELLFTWIERVAVGGVFLFALLWRAPYTARSLTYDELFVVLRFIKDHPFTDVFRHFWLTNHIGYSAIAYWTYNFLGRSEWTLRLPALVFGMGGIVLFWWWTRRYFGRWAAFLVTVLLAFSPAHFTWSTTARGYPALVFFAMLSTILYLEHLRAGRVRFPRALAVVNFLALSFHVLFIVVPVIQAVHLGWVLWADRNRTGMRAVCGRAWAALGASIAVALAVYLPITAPIWVRLAGENHERLIATFPLLAFTILTAVPLWPAGALLAVLMMAGVFLPVRTRPLRWRSYAGVLFLSFFFLWFLRPNFLTPRFFAYLLPFWFLFMAITAAWLIRACRGFWRGAMVGIVLAGLIALCWLWRVTPSWLVQDDVDPFRDAVQAVEKAVSPQARFCAFGDIHSDYFFQYYAQRPVTTISSLEAFQQFGAQGGDIVCFNLPRFAPSGDNLKIVYILSKYGERKRLGTVDAYFLKGTSR